MKKIAKLKDNQQYLKEKTIETVESFNKPIFLNINKDNKVLPIGKTIMIDIKRACHYRDNLVLNYLNWDT